MKTVFFFSQVQVKYYLYSTLYKNSGIINAHGISDVGSNDIFKLIVAVVFQHKLTQQ
jgi:hypothetical protein